MKAKMSVGLFTVVLCITLVGCGGGSEYKNGFDVVNKDYLGKYFNVSANDLIATIQEAIGDSQDPDIRASSNSSALVFTLHSSDASAKIICSVYAEQSSENLEEARQSLVKSFTINTKTESVVEAKLIGTCINAIMDIFTPGGDAEIKKNIHIFSGTPEPYGDEFTLGTTTYSFYPHGSLPFMVEANYVELPSSNIRPIG